MQKSVFVIACCAVCALFAPVVRAQTVVVQPGDVLGTIAERELGASSAWRVLCDLNTDVLGGDCNRLVPGMVLTLPGGMVDAPAPAPIADPAADPTVIVSPVTGETIRLHSFAADIDEAVAAVTAEPPALPEEATPAAQTEAEVPDTALPVAVPAEETAPDAAPTVAEPDTAPLANPPGEDTEPAPEIAPETVQAVAPQPAPQQPSPAPAPVVALETVSVQADSPALPVSTPAPDTTSQTAPAPDTQQPERAAVLDLPKTDPAPEIVEPAPAVAPEPSPQQDTSAPTPQAEQPAATEAPPAKPLKTIFDLGLEFTAADGYRAGRDADGVVLSGYATGVALQDQPGLIMELPQDLSAITAGARVRVAVTLEADVFTRAQIRYVPNEGEGGGWQEITASPDARTTILTFDVPPSKTGGDRIALQPDPGNIGQRIKIYVLTAHVVPR